MAGKIDTLHSAATATANGRTFGCKGFPTVAFQVSGTFVGTITWEAKIDSSNWIVVDATNLNDSNVATTATVVGLYRVQTAGLSDIRAKITAYTSGAITVKAQASSHSV